MVILYAEITSETVQTRMAYGEGTATSDAMGLLAMGQHKLWDNTHRG